MWAASPICAACSASRLAGGRQKRHIVPCSYLLSSFCWSAARRHPRTWFRARFSRVVPQQAHPQRQAEMRRPKEEQQHLIVACMLSARVCVVTPSIHPCPWIFAKIGRRCPAAKSQPRLGCYFVPIHHGPRAALKETPPEGGEVSCSTCGAPRPAVLHRYGGPAFQVART